MKKIILKGALIASVFGVILSCSDDESNPVVEQVSVSKEAVITNYAKMVAQNYTDSYNKAVILQTKVNEFVATPTAAGLTQVKQAWLDAREPYGQSEVVRETNSPIDVAQSAANPWGIENEGQLNAWPCDEGLIDYVLSGTEAYAGDHSGGYISGTDAITEVSIIALNGVGGDKKVSTGWHAIEFLLWGQDNTIPSANTPGQRPLTDYTTDANATRRKTYLQEATNLLVSDLQALKSTWAAGGTYRVIFEALNEDIAIKQFVHGAFFMAGDELSSERMIAPVNSIEGIDGLGQEDEHSCFSDNTHRDIYANARGVFNVVEGTYDNINGASFYQLVNQVNTTQGQKLLDALNEAKTKVNVIANHSKPFDELITLESSSDSSFGPVMQGVQALENLANEISASALVLGINLNS